MQFPQRLLFAALVPWLLSQSSFSADIPLADFEQPDFGEWSISGTAFGTGPAHGTLPGQMKVDGYEGRGLASSFHGGDDSTGTLTSPSFQIRRRFIRFLIGGGGFEGETCMNLLVDGRIVRTATGPNTKSGGSEHLSLHGWDVQEFAGKQARLQIVDSRKGGWGHVSVDQISQSDQKPPAILTDVAREWMASEKYLHFPIRTGAPLRKMRIYRDGKFDYSLDIELADQDPQWWAPIDISRWKGQRIKVVVDKLPEDSKALSSVRQNNTKTIEGGLYREALRPQIHFSPERGWNNDPNGLVYYKGEYHQFFQHNPVGWNWGNMHWGHSVSRDLIHWQELGDKLTPDDFGPMFSGSAVVDWKNSSGFGTSDKPPLVLIYTAAGNPTVQCIAWSTDGRTFNKYSGNPVLRQISPGNRDPKVYWHEPTHKWVMALYVEQDKRHTIQFHESPDLKNWTRTSMIEGYYECPDYFPLDLDGDPSKRKWVLTAASSEYQVGMFDGRSFTPQTPKIRGHAGRGFYAAQTFADLPARDGRRIQIGWLQAPSPGMPFNQCMSLPLELGLVTTEAGPRMTFAPARELTALRSSTVALGGLHLTPGGGNPLGNLRGECLEIRAEFEAAPGSSLSMFVRGIPIFYDSSKQEIVINGHKAAAPSRGGKQSLILYTDRTVFELFTANGLTYVPLPVLPQSTDLTVSLAAQGGDIHFTKLEGYILKSIH